MQVDVMINLVRERPAVYDPTDRSHWDRDVIAALWKEVAAALNCKGFSGKASSPTRKNGNLVGVFGISRDCGIPKYPDRNDLPIFESLKPELSLFRPYDPTTSINVKQQLASAMANEYERMKLNVRKNDSI
ncbi:putative Alcohol dehydrogenase transcription factor Myb/SANT-like-containing protein 5 [Homarus americanus]|uniref:Putative Alcohol dehydrogenase transcription factor Myb/SANT-like-containing protein 5 n=1 Tax=Homarus americanus TaxID=6706 RepID=A0A8J5JVE2_HOMAM|nr:putative Alcohol dehydrogenase transcription factor Myb/SANT-like-containing protein 5 [Homarus americanus]